MKKFSLFFIKSLSIISILFLVSGCGDLSGSYSGADQLTDQVTDQISSSTAQGNKYIGGKLFKQIKEDLYLLEGTMSLGGNSAHNFHLTFQLPAGENLKFFLYSPTPENLAAGTTFTFSRPIQPDDQKVILTIELNGKKHSHQLVDFPNNQENIDLEIDFHNDHTDAHILLWHKEGPYADSEECTFEQQSSGPQTGKSLCLYNSEDFAFDTWMGVGRSQGVYWGVQGKKDLIIKLTGPLKARSNA